MIKQPLSVPVRAGSVTADFVVREQARLGQPCGLPVGRAAITAWQARRRRAAQVTRYWAAARALAAAS